MVRYCAAILCSLMPALGMAQQARESGAAELRWLDRTTGALQNIVVTQEAPSSWARSKFACAAAVPRRGT